MTVPLALLAVAGGLVVLAAVLAAVEAALPRIGRARAREIVDSGARGARPLARLVADPGRSLTVSTLVRVTAEVTAVATVTVAAGLLTGVWWQGLLAAAPAMAIVSYMATGAAPRAFGQRFPEPVALSGAPLLRTLDTTVGWLAAALTWAATAVVGGRPTVAGPFATEAELRDLLERAEESSVIDREENLMAQRVLTLGSLTAREVMVPRTDMLTVGRTVDLLDAMDLFLRSGFSRLPVVGNDADDIVGVCYIKDVAARLHPHPGADRWHGPVPSGAGTVEEIMRSVLFVPESKAADDLLRELQAASVHLAVVIDEYGGVAGLATIEDLLEEIVGPISDEYDQEVPEAEELGRHRWRVSARMHLHSLSELVDLPVDDDDVDTVGGLLAKSLGAVPLPGAATRLDRIRLTAETRDARKNRLRTVLVEVVEPVAADPAPVEERANA
ncbi:MAG: hemolysin family protein [Kineosporiaceae bacterium]